MDVEKSGPQHPDERRISRWTIGVWAVVILAGTAVGVLTVVSLHSDDPLAQSNQSAGPATALVTRYGCPIRPSDSEIAPDATYVDPSCTDPRVVEDTCNTPLEGMRLPPQVVDLPEGTQSIFAVQDGRYYASLTRLKQPAEAIVRISCPDGESYDFTADEWETFNSAT